MAKVKLTEKEEKFVQNYLDGMDLVEAYTNAYDVDSKQHPAKLRYAAKLILDRPHVRSRFEMLIMERNTEFKVDQKFVIDILKRTAIERFGTSQGVRAAELLGKTLNMFVETHVVEDSNKFGDTLEEIWNAKKEGKVLTFDQSETYDETETDDVEIEWDEEDDTLRSCEG